MSPQELRELQLICAVFRKLEHFSEDAQYGEKDLEELIRRIRALSNLENPILRRLSQYADHLHDKMPLRHFVTIMVPFERLLNKSVQDDDILITTNDSVQKIETQKAPLILILDNLRSAFNTGSIFRTADGLGIEKIFLCGYTPTPENEKIKKTTLGSDQYVSWEYHQNVRELIKDLKIKGYHIVALETAEEAVNLQDDFITTPTVFVFGNERFGLDSDVLKLCHEIRKIPMVGVKNSLNVSVCAAVCIWEWKKQWQTTL